MTEVLSAFYWRENLHLSTPVGAKRTSEEVNLLRKRVAELRAEGKTQKQVAAEIGISHRYVQDLDRKKRK